jgi:hypothetical protein
MKRKKKIKMKMKTSEERSEDKTGHVVNRNKMKIVAGAQVSGVRVLNIET